MKSFLLWGGSLALLVAGFGCGDRGNAPLPESVSAPREDHQKVAGSASPQDANDEFRYSQPRVTSPASDDQTPPQELPPATPLRTPVDTSGEDYDSIEESGFQSVAETPLSTFSIDVDTASYANVRRFLESGQIPPPDAVRLEELINYFPYEDPQPTDDRPFAVRTEVAECPWNPVHQLVRIGLKGREIETSERRSANLVFLIDVSGSMSYEDKLPLVKRSLHRLLEELGERDRVSIVTYASGTQVVLPPTTGNHQHLISTAIDRLHAGGSTNGSAGLQLAYEVASRHFDRHGTNRIILCSDNDFNVGITDERALIALISREAKSGVFLTVLGFGTGNYHDARAEQLADHGNGNYAYIDSYSEARKVLVEQMSGTLETIAKDVKIQVEFNPANVAAYRLIGYENRTLAARDFRDDNKDAGEIGAGHSVTAFYEVVPPGREIPDGDIPPLKYQSASRADVDDDLAGELMNVRLRYKLPSQDQGTEFVHSVSTDVQPFQKASDDFRFGAAVTGFGMLVRRSSYAEPLDWRSIRQWAGGAIGRDANGYRTEFLDLVSHAEQLIPRTPRAPREVTRAVSPSSPLPSPGTAQVKIPSSDASDGGNQVGPRDLVVLLILIAACSLISILQKHTSPITGPSELPS